MVKHRWGWMLAGLLACGMGDPSGDDDDATTSDDDTPLVDDDSENPDDDTPVTDDDTAPLPPCSAWEEAEEVGQLVDPSLDEVSGMVASVKNPGVLWVHEDSGGEPVLTALNSEGMTLGILTFLDVSNEDWEDLARGPCPSPSGTCLFVGDVGDNLEERTEVSILRVEEPELPRESGFSLIATPEVFPFTYPDGPQDAEALVVDGEGRPVVLTKRDDGLARVMRVNEPFPDVPREAEFLGEVPTSSLTGLPGRATAADLEPQGGRLLVRAYFALTEILLSDEGLDDLSSPSWQSIQAPIEAQGEAAAYDPSTGGIWLVSEGEEAPLYFLACREWASR